VPSHRAELKLFTGGVDLDLGRERRGGKEREMGRGERCRGKENKWCDCLYGGPMHGIKWGRSGGRVTQ